MSSYAMEEYKGCEICACAELDPLAGEGLELGGVYLPVAIVRWRGSIRCHLAAKPDDDIVAGGDIERRVTGFKRAARKQRDALTQSWSGSTMFDYVMA